MFVLFLLFSNYNSSHEVLKDAEKVLKTSPIGAVKHQCFHCAAAKLELAFGASLAIANAYMDSYISTQSAQRQETAAFPELCIPDKRLQSPINRPMCISWRKKCAENSERRQFQQICRMDWHDFFSPILKHFVDIR